MKTPRCSIYDRPHTNPAPCLPALPAASAQRGAAGARARDAAFAAGVRVPAVRDPRRGGARRDLVNAGAVPYVARPAGGGGGGAALARDSGGAAVRAARGEG